MNDIKTLCKKKKIHFIGIGGISMSSLAKYFLEKGYTVSGSDISETDIIKQLEKANVKIFLKHSQDNIQDVEVVVYNSAISENNAELLKAKELGKFVITRAALLTYVSSQFKDTVAVCGSHGKTTATAMTANILLYSDKKICAHIGGEDLNLSNFFYSGDDIFVTEACEYKKNFLMLEPDVCVILNIDADHTECYTDENDLISTFELFASKCQTVISNCDDDKIKDIKSSITFGLNPNSNYRAVKIKKKGYPTFTVLENGKKMFRLKLTVCGQHNIYNALSAIAVARHFKMDAKTIKNALSNFKGIKRRFEYIGEISGAKVICDYAHHPREIMSVIYTAKQLYKNLYVVFQPHTYSRTINLFEDFLISLSGIKNLIIYKTYAAREVYNYEGSALRLSQNLSDSLYFENIDKLYEYLNLKLTKKDTLLVLGAGDIYALAKDMINKT